MRSVNGSPATEAFLNRAGTIVAYGRPGNKGGYIVQAVVPGEGGELVDGMLKKGADQAAVMRWLGDVEAIPAGEAGKPGKSKKAA